MLNVDEIPNWILSLETEDLGFIKRFMLCSGSLKDMAKQYGVSYPTVRSRLDRFIEKIRSNDSPEKDPFIDFVKSLALDGKIDIETAKDILKKYKEGGKNDN